MNRPAHGKNHRVFFLFFLSVQRMPPRQNQHSLYRFLCGEDSHTFFLLNVTEKFRKTSVLTPAFRLWEPCEVLVVLWDSFSWPLTRLVLHWFR